MSTSRARANTNIALIKYWGKRDTALNLPATGSLSMTLSSLGTETRVTFDDGFTRDEMRLDGRPVDRHTCSRTFRFLDIVRKAAGIDSFARVESENNFPTASGLASSASGFAALALAATRAAGMSADLPELARLARLGSGSAPRSLLGGLVELRAGESPDGADCIPVQIAAPDAWDIRLVVAMNSSGAKHVGSTEGMERTRLTSPYYREWLRANRMDLGAAREAVAGRDFSTLGRLTEASCFRMHAVAMSADPSILYWNAATLDTISAVRAMRDSGLEGYVTVDAGPHVKTLCRAADADAIAREVETIRGIERVVIEKPGPGAEVIE